MKKAILACAEHGFVPGEKEVLVAKPGKSLVKITDYEENIYWNDAVRLFP
jgi:hypothetical protein